MSDELAIVPENALASFQALQNQLGIVPVDDKALAGLSGDFLPRVMLMQALSRPVTAEKIKAGNFGLVSNDKENPQDLGEVFDAFVIHVRAKAMYVEGETIVDDVYDTTDPIFSRIRQDANAKVDGEANMYGAEFLLYLLKEKKFATFFYGNGTLRREIGTTKGMCGKAVTFQKKKITAKGKTWFGITTFVCVTPYADGPSTDELKTEVERFQKASPKKREAAPGVPVSRDR